MYINFCQLATIAKVHTASPVQKKFIWQMNEEFALQWNINTKVCINYIQSKDGLECFVEFLNEKGFICKSYFLPPFDSSPSFGILLDDQCPQWFEWKLTNT